MTPKWSCPYCGHNSCSENLDDPDTVVCDGCGSKVPDPEVGYQRSTKTGFCAGCDKTDCNEPAKECSSYALMKPTYDEYKCPNCGHDRELEGDTWICGHCGDSRKRLPLNDES